jgi:hypothetical protein
LYHMHAKLLIVLSATLLAAGCHDYGAADSRQSNPPPIGADWPPPIREIPKPLPPAEYSVVQNEPPSAIPQALRDWVDVYNKVGRPRIVVYVNRTMGSRLIGEQQNELPSSSTVLPINTYRIEQTLIHHLSVDRQVTIVPSETVLERLTSDDLRSIQAGQTSALKILSAKLDAQVLIQVQPRPDSADNLSLVAQALNIEDSVKLGQATTPLGDIDSSSLDLSCKIAQSICKTWTSPRVMKQNER